MFDPENLFHPNKFISVARDAEIIRKLSFTEQRFCDRCMMRRIHDVIQEEDVVYTYRRKRLYRCKKCGRESYKSGMRPSAESVY